MNKSWLFWHIVEVLRTPTGSRKLDIFCPAWLAKSLGAAGFCCLVALLVVAWL
jgi:hypothetical protein